MTNKTEFNEQVQQIFSQYPAAVSSDLESLRALVYEEAEMSSITDLQETLKWGEPSYVCKNGSTLRMDWTEKGSDFVSIYVNCNSKVMSLFLDEHPDALQTVGQREIRLPVGKQWPEDAIRSLIHIALNYHRIKK
jgi:hypothetical protein